MRLLSSITFLFVVTFQACSINVGVPDPNLSGVSVEQQKISNAVFSDAVTLYKIHVVYETGAEPYIGPLGLSGNDTWDIAKESYIGLFQNHTTRSIQVPSTLNEMIEISDQGKTSWDQSELLQLGKSVAEALTSGSQINSTVIFLNGLYEGNSNILGIQFSGFHFSFVFKDVVLSTGGDGVSQRYVEQATVVHEVGHSIGLVNNGVPMKSLHEDSEHPHHTLNEQGVMYWAVESRQNILTFLVDIIAGSQLNLFGAETLNDCHSFHK